MVSPEREWSEDAMVLVFSTKELLASSSAANRDVLVEMAACLVVGVREDGTKAKAFVAVPRAAAIAMELVEKSFMVVISLTNYALAVITKQMLLVCYQHKRNGSAIGMQCGLSPAWLFLTPAARGIFWFPAIYLWVSLALKGPCIGPLPVHSGRRLEHYGTRTI